MGMTIASTARLRRRVLQVYRRLEKLVAGPGFLAKLTAALSKQPATFATHAHTDGEVTRPEWWVPPVEAAATEGDKAGADYEEVGVIALESKCIVI